MNEIFELKNLYKAQLLWWVYSTLSESLNLLIEYEHAHETSIILD